MYHIVDRERRQFRGDFETREEAEKRLAELLEEEPEAEGLLVIRKAGRAATPNAERFRGSRPAAQARSRARRRLVALSAMARRICTGVALPSSASSAA
jgi:hypothetical protein